MVALLVSMNDCKGVASELPVQGVLFLDVVICLVIVVVLSIRRTMGRDYHIFCAIALLMPLYLITFYPFTNRLPTL